MTIRVSPCMSRVFNVRLLVFITCLKRSGRKIEMPVLHN